MISSAANAAINNFTFYANIRCGMYCAVEAAVKERCQNALSMQFCIIFKGL